MQSIPENNALPSEDLDRIIMAYLRVSQPRIVEHPGNFAKRILDRAYTEWCMEHQDSRQLHRTNFATGLREFIDEETHHELIRSSYKWNQEAGRFERITSEQYQITRGRVIDALVKWSLDYFDPYNNSQMWGKKCGEKNIRISLADYLK